MKLPSTLNCDICKKVVSVRKGLFFYTEKPYVKVRYEEPATVTLASMTSDNFSSGSTCKKGHICMDCWGKVTAGLDKERHHQNFLQILDEACSSPIDY